LKKFSIGRFLTLREVMEKYDKSYTQVRYATETNRLIGKKVGWGWIYPIESLPPVWPDTLRKYRKVRREQQSG